MSQLPKEVTEIRQSFLYLSNLIPSLSTLITLGYFQVPSYTKGFGLVHPKPLVHRISVSRIFSPILQISVHFLKEASLGRPTGSNSCPYYYYFLHTIWRCSHTFLCVTHLMNVTLTHGTPGLTGWASRSLLTAVAPMPGMS